MSIHTSKLLKATHFNLANKKFYDGESIVFFRSRKILKSRYASTTVSNWKMTSTEQTNEKNKDAQPNTSFANTLPLTAMPGPGGLTRLPYIGTLLQFKPFSKFTLQTYGSLACHLHDKYGQVFRIRLGKDYVVHTCKVEDIENIFRQEPKFPLRRLMNLGKVYRERSGLPQGLGSCHGEEWYALRKPLNATLKRPKAVQSYVPALDKVAEDFIERILEIKGQNPGEMAEKMFELFFKYSSEGIGVACFNQRLGFLSHDLDNFPEKKALLNAYRTSVEYTFRDIMGQERRYMKTDKDKFYQTYRDTMKYIRKQSLKFVEKAMPRSSTHDDGVRHNTDAADGKSNLLQTLVRRKDLNTEQILAIIDSLLIGGTDSTARMLTVLLYDMAMNQDIQAKIARDVRAFAGPRGPITNDCIEDVRLLRACMRESMRVHHPTAVGLERILTHDMVISGYRVPAGTSVFVTGMKTCMDPTHFPNPTEFRPERWLRAYSPKSQNIISTEVNETMNNSTSSSSSSLPSSSAFAFLPFGHGVRSCIGSRFAEIELLVGLAKVLQVLQVSVHPSYKSLDVYYSPFVTPVKPVPFLFTKRD